MNFSICTIVKNEANTLPRYLESLGEFRNKGGVICVLDTGSTDGTPDIARKAGCKVEEVGEKFITTISKRMAYDINKRFIVNNEPRIVEPDDKLFDFAAARNYCASMAPTDMVIAVDADEYFTTFNLDKISKLVEKNPAQFETHFVFAHDRYGKPTVQFLQSRFYNKKKMYYTGIIHEVLAGEGGRVRLSKDIYMLEHKQESGKSHRSSYLTGLAFDCYQHQDKDRQSHYFARELMYSGRYYSAIAEFKRHISMKAWELEAAQSMTYIGDCYGRLGNTEKEVKWYQKSFHFNSNRREALLKLAGFYKFHKNVNATAAYAAAALEIPKVEYYSNRTAHYAQYPHELLYWAKGWQGDIESARYHITKALEYQPLNPAYLKDLKYYFPVEETTMEPIEFRYITKSDEFDDSYSHWSRKYEYPTVINILKNLFMDGTPKIHNTAWGYTETHIKFKNELEMIFGENNVINSDIRESNVKNTCYYDIKKLSTDFADKFDCVLNISTLEHLEGGHGLYLKNLYNQVKSGGYLILTFDLPGLQLAVIEDMINKSLAGGSNGRITGGIDSWDPTLNVGLLVLHKTSKEQVIKFRKERIINRLALPITRACNRKCPECPAVEKGGKHIPIEELARIGKLIGPIQKIEITGGEPSIHPEFESISKVIHSLFDCKDIMLLTNGWFFGDPKNLLLLLNYDRIYITHYTDRFARTYDEKSNTALVNEVGDYLRDHPSIHSWVQEMDSHVSLNRSVPDANGCIFNYDKGNMISYYDGKLYGCCTAWQLDYKGKGIPLTEDWREHLNEIELPCNKCFLGKKVYKEELIGV